jgi:hypothetical protein
MKDGEMSGARSIREVENAYRILVGSPERKGSLRKPKYRWEDSIKMHLKEIRWEGRSWIM